MASSKLLAQLFQAILAEATASDSALAEELAFALQAAMTETSAQPRAALPTSEEMAASMLQPNAMTEMLALPTTAIQSLAASSPPSLALLSISATSPVATLL